MSDARSNTPSRRGRRAAVVLLSGLILLAAVPALALGHATGYGARVGYARPDPALTNETVLLNVTDTAFVPSTITVPSNSVMDIHVHNPGTYAHTFTLVAANQTNRPINSSYSPAQLDAYFHANPPQANLTLAPNTSGWANLSTPVVGSYEFVSVVPYQFQAGLWGTLKVQATGPAQRLTDNTTNSFAFDPAILAATPPSPGGATSLELEVTNVGDFPHTFTLAAESNATIGSVGYFAGHAPLVNVTVPSTAGESVWANFTVPAPGIYEFVCTVPGHFQAGMFGFLYIGVPVPVPPPPPSTAVVQVGVLLGALVLLGIGVVLVVTAGFVGRFTPPPGSGGGHH